MISFTTPCLKWKLVAALKLQEGWPGFIAPYQTRYLNKHVVITTIPTIGYGTPDQQPAQIRTQDFFLDHFGNATVNPDPIVADADFPYGQPLTEDPAASETWEVTETYFKHVYNNGYFFITTEVTLSNPYTIEQLNADLDALIAGVDVNSVPWNTLTIQISPDLSFTGDPNGRIPSQYNYAGFFHGPQFPVPLRSAAYSAFIFGDVSFDIWFPNAGVKVVGYLAMAGNYCLNKFTIDNNQNLLDQACQSGIGSCAGAFQVTPPPVNPDNNTYIVLTPNCQCGGPP